MRPLPEFLSAILAPGARVLDLGCGTGRLARDLAAAGFRVAAVDSDLDAVSTGRELGAAGSGAHATVGPDWVAARAEALPFARGAFDAVTCIDVLHWAPDATGLRALWLPAWEALSPGGVFLARCLLLDRIPSARPAGNGRYRLPSGAEWFLPDQALLAALPPPSAEPFELFPDVEDGAAFALWRKPRVS